MSDERAIEYDYGSTISFLVSLQTMCVLFGGFAFTGITIVITLGEPSTLLAQIILFVLYNGMGMFVGAVSELNNMNNLISLQSPKQIIPIYPVRWRTINILMTLGNFAVQLSITLMFLLKNLIPLFVLSTSIMIFWFLWSYLRSWKPIEKELHRRGILKLR